MRKFTPDFSVLAFFLALFTIFRSASIGDALIVIALFGYIAYCKFLKSKELPQVEIDLQRRTMLDQIEMLKIERDLNLLKLDKAKIANTINGVQNEQNKKYVF